MYWMEHRYIIFEKYIFVIALLYTAKHLRGKTFMFRVANGYSVLDLYCQLIRPKKSIVLEWKNHKNYKIFPPRMFCCIQYYIFLLYHTHVRICRYNWFVNCLKLYCLLAWKYIHLIMSVICMHRFGMTIIFSLIRWVT